MSKEGLPTILLPETFDPTVAALEAAHLNPEEVGANLRFEEMTLDDAAKLLREGEVDILIAGAHHDSSTIVRTAIHGVNRALDPENKKPITSFFVMEKDGEEPLFFADCAIMSRDDSPEAHAAMAAQTCESVRQLGYEPVVAFISVSTFGSAAGIPSVDRVKTAAEVFKQNNPDTISYGEIQMDAALNKKIFEKKAAKAGIELVDGKLPNVFIFPDAESGNMVYKSFEQAAGRVAVGPMLNGVAKDMHDLSRGVSLEGLQRSCEIAALLYNARQDSSLDQQSA